MNMIIFDENKVIEVNRKNRIDPEKLLPLLQRIKNRSASDYSKLIDIICIYADENYLNIR